MLKFKDKKVAAKYNILCEKDIHVKLPEGYIGAISGITKPEMVEAMIKRGSNLVAAVETSPATPPSSKKDDKK